MIKRLAVDATIAMLVGQGTIFLTPLIINAQVQGWALPYSRAADLSSLEMVLLAVTGIMTAKVLTPGRWRQAFAWGAGLVACGDLLSALAPNLQWLVVARVLAALGGGLASAVGAAMLGSSDDAETDTNHSFALLNCLFAILLIGLPWLPGARLFFSVLGGALAIAAVLRARWIPTCAPRAVQATVVQTVRITPLLLFFAGVTLLWIIAGAVFAYSGQSGARVGLSDSQIGATLSVANIVGMVACAAAGSLGKNWNGAIAFTLTSILAVAAGAVSIATPSATLFIGAILAFLAGNMLQTTYGLAAAGRMDSNGRIAAAFLSWIAIPFAIGPALGARLIDLYSRITVSYLAVLSGAVALVMAAASVRARKLGAVDDIQHA